MSRLKRRGRMKKGGEEEITFIGGMSDCIHMAKAKLSIEKRISNMPKRHRISDECSSNMFFESVLKKSYMG